MIYPQIKVVRFFNLL